MKKIISFMICFIMLFTYIPLPEVWADTSNPNPDSGSGLPQTPEAYASSDYAKYGAKMAAGLKHMAAVKEDGTVVAWGDNSQKQTEVPAGLSGVKAVAAGTYHTLALKEDGTITGWGNYKSVTDGTITQYSIPAELQGVQIKAIAAGEEMSAAVKADGTVMIWGYNKNNLTVIPAELTGKNVVSVAINNNGAAALDTTGHVTYWGAAVTYGAAPTGGDIVAVAPGFRFWVALKKDGTAVVWGDSNQLNNETCIDIVNEKEIRAIGAGRKLTVAVLKDGTVKALAMGTGQMPVSNGISPNGAAGIKAITAAPAFVKGMASNALTMGDSGQVTAYYGDSSPFEESGMPAGLNLMANPPSLSGDADLSSLEVAGQSLNPAFNASVTGYAISVPNEVSGISVKVTASSSKASLKINGNNAQSGVDYTVDGLVVGKNEINIRVKAEDDTEKIYIITAIRAGDSTEKSSDSRLRGLSVEGCTLDPNFGWANTSYIISVPKNETGVTVTAVTFSDKATLKINGKAVSSGVAYQVGINETCTSVAIQVTAEDGKTITTYSIAVNKDAELFKSNADLKGLQILTSDGYNIYTMYPAFRSESSNYAVYVPENQKSLNIKALTVSLRAKLEINGVEAVRGQGSIVKIPAEGYMTVAVKVTAEDGTPKTYTIKVNDAPYHGPGLGIPQSPAVYNASEFAQAGRKVVGTGDFMALNMDGTVKSGDSINQHVAWVNLPGILENVTAITATKGNCKNAMALKQDGTVTVWGDKDSEAYKVPDTVKDVTAIDAGFGYFLALKKDGTVAAWGDNSKGQCNVHSDLKNVIAISTGSYHTLALKADGTVAAWGDNSKGQCDVPADLEEVACIYAKSSVSVAIKSDGTVVAWGKNNAGNPCNVPADLKDVVSVAISEMGSDGAALKADGTVVTWGNTCGVPGLHDVSSICVDSHCLVAVKKDGTAIGTDFSMTDKLRDLKNVLSVLPGGFVIYRSGKIGYIGYSENSQEVQAAADGVNVLSEHYFDINGVELLNAEGQSVTSAAVKGSYTVKARIDNYYCEGTKGNVIIQVRGGEGASASGGGRVISCIKQECNIPLTGTTVSADVTIPEDISGTVYIDVFVWDKGDKLAPRASANRSIKVTVNKQ